MSTLITGATAGIGKSLAFEFAARGHNLILLARREELLQQVKKEIQERHPSLAVFVKGVDVTDAAALSRSAEEGTRVVGPIDIAVANAGFAVGGRLDRLTVSDYQRQFDVNVFGVINTVHAVLPSLKATRGRLCLIGSTTAYLSFPGNSAYCMSKYAVRSLAEALYGELAQDGISVTLINPGYIKTDIRLTDNQGRFRAEYRDPIPAWLMMEPRLASRKIARAVLKRKREKNITAHSQLAIWGSRFFPGLVAYFLKTSTGS